MDIYYNIENNLSVLDKIDENTNFLSSDRLISIPYIYISDKYTELTNNNEYLLSVLSNVISTYTNADGTYISSGCFSILDRINIYLYSIKNNLSSIKDIFKQEIADAKLSNKISCNSCFDKVKSLNTTFGLTEYNVNTIKTFNLLSAFFNETANTVFKKNSFETKGINLNDYLEDLNDSMLNKLLNCLNCNVTYDSITATYTNFLVKLQCKKSINGGISYTSLIDCSDILIILNKFIQLLKNTKYVSFSMVHNSSEKITSLSAYAKIPQYIYSGSAYANISLGNNVNIVISPWSSLTMTNSDILILNANNTEFKPTQNYRYNDSFARIISLRNLIYDVSSGANIQKNLSLTLDCTNGIFGNNLNITKNNRFKLTLSDILRLFNIYQTTVISRKNILAAIDYIFMYWLENMSIIQYDIVTCHNNCHTNSVGATYSKNIIIKTSNTVTHTGYLHFTNSGCGCGDKTLYTVNLYSLIPDKYKTTGDGSLTLGELTILYIKGGYTDNTSSPSSINIGSTSVFTDCSANSGTTTTSSITWLNNVTVSATRDTSLKIKKQLFCLKIIITASYSWNKEILPPDTE